MATPSTQAVTNASRVTVSVENKAAIREAKLSAKALAMADGAGST